MKKIEDSKLPHFLCVGAQKAGTTAFYDLIKDHPHVCMSSKKEIHFFDIDSNYKNGTPWYESFFTSKKGHIKGEVTPDYMLYDYIPQRIFNTLGKDVKIIFVLRNPIQRAYSQFNFHIMKGVEFRTDFFKVIQEEEPIDQINSEYKHWYDPAYYIARGLYSNQIERFMKYFEVDQMIFIKYEDLFGSNQKDIWSKLCKSLEIPFWLPGQQKASNVTLVPNKGLMGKVLKQIKKSNSILIYVKKLVPLKLYHTLRTSLLSKMETKADILDKKKVLELNKKYYESDIRKLEVITNLDFSSWLKE